jgi:hypothetical protein
LNVTTTVHVHVIYLDIPLRIRGRLAGGHGLQVVLTVEDFDLRLIPRGQSDVRAEGGSDLTDGQLVAGDFGEAA